MYFEAYSNIRDTKYFGRECEDCLVFIFTPQRSLRFRREWYTAYTEYMMRTVWYTWYMWVLPLQFILPTTAVPVQLP